MVPSYLNNKFIRTSSVHEYNLRGANLVPRACDPWEGNEGSGIIRLRNEYDWLLVYNGMLQFCKN
jgi:hypothetical protein